MYAEALLLDVVASMGCTDDHEKLRASKTFSCESYDHAMNIGDKVPEFEMLDQQGASVSLGDLLSDGRLVLYFYIKAKTSG